MLKIRALNRDSLSDEDAPTIRKEAQEEIALDLYNKGLAFETHNDYDKAEEIFEQLLDDNIPQLESQGGLPKTMSTLKYSCYNNLGRIADQRNEIGKALDNYVKASELDETDVSLWYKVGVLSLKLDRFRQAIFAFTKGLECNENHWPTLDNLIVLLFCVHDTIGCLYYITKALLLDAEYTRGLVLRREIYASNSATREYYQLCNPDHVYEPDLDVDIDEEDVKVCLEDVNRLSDRINAAERALGPKPLPCIPLPVPLEEFTWLHLGKTVTGVHKYISDNNMTHFCKIDLSKCMSQSGANQIAATINVEMRESRPNVEVANQEETVQEEEVMEVEVNVERRLSQNSEHNDSAVENLTGSQAEDNDEMDQDTEDPDENGDQKGDKKPTSKRKRDLLSDLQIWGWHSKKRYQKKGKSEKDLTIEDAIKRIIPAHLLPNNLNDTKIPSNDDSMNTMDIYNQFIEREPSVSCLSPMSNSNAPTAKTYFGSAQEKEDVLKFWKKQRRCCDAVTLIQEYVHTIAELWSHQWPHALKEIYLAAYVMYREHFEHPPLFARDVDFDALRIDALVTVLWGELLYFQECREIRAADGMHATSLVQLHLLSSWDDRWRGEFLSFYIRVHWLRMHFFRKSGENTLAIRALNMIQQEIELIEKNSNEKYCLKLPNCSRYSLITSDITDKFLKHLEMIESLNRVQDLYASKSYADVANILKSIFTYPGSAAPTCGRMGRPAQLGMLMHALWFTDRDECFVWSEECLNEAVACIGKTYKDQDKWEMVLHKCLAILHELIKTETVCVIDRLVASKRTRLVENLCEIARYQLGSAEHVAAIPLNTILPWIVLHYVLLREEHREQARRAVSHVRGKHTALAEKEEEEPANANDEGDIPASIAILFSAHEFLGRRGWCLTNHGELLHFIVDRILDRLDTPIFEHLRDKIDIHLEQAFFCLYQYPSKKNKVSRHLADHNVNPLPLTWDRAEQLYEFFCPDHLPEFDSFKSISIAADLEQLLQRLIAIVPQQYDVHAVVPQMQAFVNATTDTLPDAVPFPAKTRAIYYLLGDYYFKQNEVAKSVKYFLLDLCVNPTRSDTWADLALGLGSQLEMKLNHCERFRTEVEFFEKARSARACFQQALKLVNDHVTLWIEFGAFEYMLHSFCSRMLKFESDTFSMEKFEALESQKEGYLDGSGASFTRALDLYQPDQAEADERWLHHYMLAKVAEKKRKEPVDYLQHYLTAAALLNENKATYPDKINYYNPQHLSVEALEIHYRIHASILKYLELHEGKPIAAETGKVLKKCLDTAKLYETTARVVDTPKVATTTTQAVSDAARKLEEEAIRADVRKCVEEMLRKVEEIVKIDSVSDVIVLDEDEDDAPKVEAAPKQIGVKNPEAIMDALMQEAMKDAHEMEVDSSGNEASKAKEDMEIKRPVEKGTKTEESSTAKSIEEITSSASSDSTSSDSDSDDSSSSSSGSSSSGNASEFMSNSEIETVIDRCIVGLEQCVLRLPQNYKALYRLAHFFYHHKGRKDLTKSRQLLLGEYKCKSGGHVSGLFSDRKNNNLFNGVWRIPSSEIDRPGSLAAHMSRCVALVLQVLCSSKDHQKLLDVCLQLRRTPDPNKIYIRHSEREQLAEQALSLCIQSVRTQIKNLPQLSKSFAQKFVLDMFKCYQRVQKHLPHKESTFATMFGDAYKTLMNDKVPDSLNVVDLATKFCQQYKASEKIKQQVPKPQATPPVPPMPTAPPPVLPTPFTATPTVTPPLKRPTLGRPRGRPPGPSKAPRAGTRPSDYSWQHMMKYMMNYQEQLLRQYNTFTQMNQLNALANQLSNAPAPQNSMLNSNQLMQTLSQMGTNFNQLAAAPMAAPPPPPQPPKKVEATPRPRAFAPPPSTYAYNTAVTSKPATAKASAATVARTNPTSTIVRTQPAIVGKTVAATGFKYPTPTNVKGKHLEVPATSSLSITRSLPPPPKLTPMPSLNPDYAKATTMLGGRPNISITPVMPANAPIMTTPPTEMTCVSGGKTLQEKLADKQKQFGNRTTQQETTKMALPPFLTKSGISISQVSAGSKGSEGATEKATTKKQLHRNVQPISVSVIKTPIPSDRNPSLDDDDDDVIVIE